MDCHGKFLSSAADSTDYLLWVNFLEHTASFSRYANQSQRQSLFWGSCRVFLVFLSLWWLINCSLLVSLTGKDSRSNQVSTWEFVWNFAFQSPGFSGLHYLFIFILNLYLIEIYLFHYVDIGISWDILF